LIRSLGRKPVVTIYVRHAGSCPHDGKEFYRGCQCPKYYRYSLNGKQRREAAGTRSWATAEDGARNLQNSLDGQSPEPISQPAAQHTITAARETFIKAKHSENIRESTIRKLRFQLGLFEQFMASRSKFFPRDITAQDVIDFRATWKWGDLTKIKAQQNLRGFIRFCCKENRSEVLDALGTIKETREGKARRKPKPLSEAELKELLARVPVMFANEPAKIPRMMALIHCMVSTGLAIIDTVQLEKAALERAARNGVLEIERQKTGKTATIPIDPALRQELLSVMNGNPRYVFWHGSSMADSETKLAQRDMRDLMQSAGLYIKGNVFHRFRDTAVDFWLGAGWSMTDIAVALGDTTAVVEKHYKDWASEGMKERLAKMPVRSW
jgi:integrase